jgi:hypothetical protein
MRRHSKFGKSLRSKVKHFDNNLLLPLLRNNNGPLMEEIPLKLAK